MPRQALKTNLERLREELASPESLDDDARRELADIARTIENVLKSESPDYSAAHDSIQDAALRFEANHPAFSRIMSEVTDALAKLGT